MLGGEGGVEVDLTIPSFVDIVGLSNPGFDVVGFVGLKISKVILFDNWF